MTYKTKHSKFDRDTLWQLLDYDPQSGSLIWKERSDCMFKVPWMADRWNERYAGRPAFSALTNRGQRQGSILGEHHLASRIVWMMMTGHWPKGVVIHRDDNHQNLRWANLADVTRSVAGMQTKSHGQHSVPGVYRRSPRGRYVARIGARYIGTYPTLKAAAQARKEAREAGELSR